MIHKNEYFVNTCEQIIDEIIRWLVLHYTSSTI